MQQHFKLLHLLHIHQDKTDALNLKSIAAEFIWTNERRIGLFWTTLISLFITLLHCFVLI